MQNALLSKELSEYSQGKTILGGHKIFWPHGIKLEIIRNRMSQKLEMLGIKHFLNNLWVKKEKNRDIRKLFTQENN